MAISALTAIGAAIASAASAVAPAAAGIASVVGPALSTAGSAVAGGLGTAGSALSSGLGSVASGIGSAGSTLASGVESLGSTLGIGGGGGEAGITAATPSALQGAAIQAGPGGLGMSNSFESALAGGITPAQAGTAIVGQPDYLAMLGKGATYNSLAGNPVGKAYSAATARPQPPPPQPPSAPSAPPQRRPPIGLVDVQQGMGGGGSNATMQLLDYLRRQGGPRTY